MHGKHTHVCVFSKIYKNLGQLHLKCFLLITLHSSYMTFLSSTQTKVNPLSQNQGLHLMKRLKSQPLEGESCLLSPSENFVVLKWQLWWYLPKGRARAQSKALNIRKQLKESTLKPQNSLKTVHNLMGPQLCWLFWQPQTWGVVQHPAVTLRRRLQEILISKFIHRTREEYLA